MPENNQITFPAYFETDLSSVKLISKYEAIVIYMDKFQPKINHQKRWNEYVIEYRFLNSGELTREITEDEFKTRYLRTIDLLKKSADVETYSPVLTEVELISTNAKKIAIESADRQKFYGDALIKKNGDKFPGTIELILNRYGEIKFGTYIFDDRQADFWNAKRIGINGFIELTTEWKDFIELNVSEPLPVELSTPLNLYVYEVGGAPITGPDFNNDFNNDFKIS